MGRVKGEMVEEAEEYVFGEDGETGKEVREEVREELSADVLRESTVGSEDETTGAGETPALPAGDGAARQDLAVASEAPRPIGPRPPEQQTSGISENSETSGPEPAPLIPDPEVERLRGEIEGLRAEVESLRVREMESHRRYLLAENAGRVVPELVAGSTVEALDASVETARAAFEAVRSATIAELVAAQQVGASNGTRESAVDYESMSPMQKIAFGLRRGTE